MKPIPKSLIFNKDGYDPFIDFLKAYSILCVVIAHILPPGIYKYILFQVWGAMQVPMFILIQVFHAYKRGQKPKQNWTSLLKRIILPFVAVQTVIIGFKAINGGGNLWVSFLTGGGYGPGSYYIWIYLQIAILLVVLWPWLRRLSLNETLVIFLIISVGFELVFSVLDCPERLYRLLCVRYLFLIPLGFIWVEKGVLINKKTVLYSVISIVAVLFFVFTNYDLEPFFYNTGWKTHRWICYFYLPILLTYGLYLIWTRMKENQVIEKAVKWTAARSYEIFLSQMAVLVCLPFACFSVLIKGFVGFSIWAVLVLTLSLFFGGVIYWFRKSILKW